jgi:hypothetical protein
MPIPALTSVDPFHPLGRPAPLHILIRLLVLCLTILSSHFSRPRLRDKSHRPPSIPRRYPIKDSVKPVNAPQRSRKHYRKHRQKSLQYTILACILAVIIPQASATATNNNGISIWTLNMAGSGTALKIGTVHGHIMDGNPDIFVLTDTRSDGSTIKSQWDWKDYQIREQKGYGRSRNGGIVIGIKSHLPIVQEHTDIPGIDGRLLHVTIKTVVRGKGVRIKVIGIYAPPYLTDSTQAEDFLGKVRSWMDTIPTKDREWIMAGDLNLTLSRTEASDNTYLNHRPARTQYWKILSLPKSPGFDWWTKRERNRLNDFTRRKWGEPDDTASGKTIIDRIAS